PFSTPNPCDINGWQNGNLNSNQAHYREGDSVPYRMKMDGLATGSGALHTLTIGWDTLASSKHAIDYITSHDRTESVGNNPCAGISGCSLSTFTTANIPVDPIVTAGPDGISGNSDDISQIAGVVTCFGCINGSVTLGAYGGPKGS